MGGTRGSAPATDVRPPVGVCSLAMRDAGSGDSFDEPAFVERVRGGDPDAIGQVCRAYVGPVFRAARGAGLDPHGAEDVTQATFTAFLETVSRFEGRSSLGTWLFGILYRKLAEARRSIARGEPDDIDRVFESRFDADGAWVRPPRTPEHDLEATETREALSRCLDHVPSRQRDVFALREWQGFSTSEVCNILGLTTTNVGVMIHRARNRLRECLESMGFGPDVGS